MDIILNNFQKNPIKLYIQDIFRAKRSEHNKYFYELFGLTFKNIMIHGVVTSLYNKTNHSTNLELSDGTGTIQIYYDWGKCNKNVSKEMMKSLHRDFVEQLRYGDDNLDIKSKMMTAISETKREPANFDVGSHLCIIGDIFIDNLVGTRMMTAYECIITNVERDIVWLEELRYLYEKFYLRNEE